MDFRPAILITGAGGVVGRFLVPFLAARGVPVVAMLRRPEVQPEIPGVRWLVARIEDLGDELKGIRAVVHAAATSPGPGVTADQIVRDNIEAMRWLVEAAAAAAVPRFIFLSAVSAYGTVTAHVVDETTPSVDPDLYGLSKRVGEEMLAAYSGLPSIVLRLPAVVGPGARRNWMARVKDSILAGGPVEVFNAEAPYNNIVHLADLAELILGLVLRPLAGHDRVVLGAGGAMPVGEVVRSLMMALGCRVDVRDVVSDRSSFIIDSTRARNLLGYRPMKIDSTIRRFAADPR
ncbi:MAG: NAD(P)-dependent oxidoreductase [Magnetospirillum sp.]|nr:NAD(P)-dependent oxidoreductase [Magnetospirillum sp.]